MPGHPPGIQFFCPRGYEKRLVLKSPIPQAFRRKNEAKTIFQKIHNYQQAIVENVDYFLIKFKNN